MARKPNYDFEKRRKEQERKAKKESKRADREMRREERQQGDDPSAAPMAQGDGEPVPEEP